MNAIKKLTICLMLLMTLFGCTFITIGEPRKEWDFASSAKDQELTIKQNTTQIGPEDKRKTIQEQNDLRYRWWIDLRSETGEPLNPPESEEERIKAFNQKIEKQLHEQMNK